MYDTYVLRVFGGWGEIKFTWRGTGLVFLKSKNGTVP